MDIEAIENYINKKVRLVLKNGYSYIGDIQKIYTSSFDFKDINDNEFSQDVETVASIQRYDENKSRWVK